MKRTTKVTALAAVIAATTAGFTYADDNFEYHGYFRSGFMMDTGDGFSRADYGDTTNKGDGTEFPAWGVADGTGRLGNELGNWWENIFIKKWDLEDGKSIRIRTTLEQAEVPGSNNSVSWLTGSNSEGNHFTQVAEAWVALGGVAGDGDLWAGRRIYNNEVYSFITDEFHLKIEGTGIGVENVTAGAGKFDLAFIAQDAANTNSLCEMPANKKILHAKYLTDGGIGFEMQYGVEQGEYELADLNGYEGCVGGEVEGDDKTNTDLAVYYNFGDFFSMGNGFSTAMLEYRTQDDGTDETNEIEATAWGGSFAGNILNFPVVSVGQATDGNDKVTTSFSLVNRLVMITPDMPFGSLGVEGGYMYMKQEEADDPVTQWKVSGGPTWAVPSGEGPTPEIRLLVGVYGEESGGEAEDERVLAGFQADLWW